MKPTVPGLYHLRIRPNGKIGIVKVYVDETGSLVADGFRCNPNICDCAAPDPTIEQLPDTFEWWGPIEQESE